MAYTSAAAVAGIIEVDSSIDLTPFIATAHELVEELCSPEGHDAERLELIERWLAAHCYATRDPRPTSERAGPVSVNYQSVTALNLNNSHYGQMAMLLDTSGALKAWNEQQGRKPTVTASWLGTAYDSEEEGGK